MVTELRRVGGYVLMGILFEVHVLRGVSAMSIDREPAANCQFETWGLLLMLSMCYFKIKYKCKYMAKMQAEAFLDSLLLAVDS